MDSGRVASQSFRVHQSRIVTIHCYQFVMCPFLNDGPIFEYGYDVCTLDRRQAVGNHHYRPADH